MSSEDLDVLTKSHPALIDSVVRWRGVGGWGATATLLRVLDAGAISVDAQKGTVSLRLVPGVATPKHSRANGPFVERKHIEGLSSFDRQMLTMLFDDIARAPTTDLSQLAAFRRAHPLTFWTLLREWREAIDEEVHRLRSCERLQVNRDLLYDLRPRLVDELHDQTITNRAWSRLAAVALAANLDDVVATTARQRWGERECTQLTGPAAVIWVSSLRSGKSSGVDVVRQLFSPMRPSSYPPAQYVKIQLPPYRRPRMVDDGSLRLGG